MQNKTYALTVALSYQIQFYLQNILKAKTVIAFCKSKKTI